MVNAIPQRSAVDYLNARVQRKLNVMLSRGVCAVSDMFPFVARMGSPWMTEAAMEILSLPGSEIAWCVFQQVVAMAAYAKRPATSAVVAYQSVYPEILSEARRAGIDTDSLLSIFVIPGDCGLKYVLSEPVSQGVMAFGRTVIPKSVLGSGGWSRSLAIGIVELYGWSRCVVIGWKTLKRMVAGSMPRDSKPYRLRSYASGGVPVSCWLECDGNTVRVMFGEDCAGSFSLARIANGRGSGYCGDGNPWDVVVSRVCSVLLDPCKLATAVLAEQGLVSEDLAVDVYDDRSRVLPIVSRFAGIFSTRGPREAVDFLGRELSVMDLQSDQGN